MSTASPEHEDENPGPLQHPDFYFHDGTAILKVRCQSSTLQFPYYIRNLRRCQLTSRDCINGVLYNLYPDLLGHRSTFFASGEPSINLDSDFTTCGVGVCN